MNLVSFLVVLWLIHVSLSVYGVCEERESEEEGGSE